MFVLTPLTQTGIWAAHDNGRVAMILSIALISKKNRPLYISSKELQHHLLSYSALDVFNERLAANSDKVDCDFGLLFYADQTSVYGYCTNTGIKFVVLIAGGQVSPDIKLVSSGCDLLLNR